MAQCTRAVGRGVGHVGVYPLFGLTCHIPLLRWDSQDIALGRLLPAHPILSRVLHAMPMLLGSSVSESVGDIHVASDDATGTRH